MSYMHTTTKRFGNLEVDIAAREVRMAGNVVHLTRTEFNLLQVLVEHPRQALSRELIISLVWGACGTENRT